MMHLIRGSAVHSKVCLLLALAAAAAFLAVACDGVGGSPSGSPPSGPTDPVPVDRLPSSVVGSAISGMQYCPSLSRPAVEGPERSADPPAIPEPNSYCGRVWIDGASAPDGTVVEAVVDGRVCDRRTTASGQYQAVIVVPHCGTPNDRVRFRIDGELAEPLGPLMHPLYTWYLDLIIGPAPVL